MKVRKETFPGDRFGFGNLRTEKFSRVGGLAWRQDWVGGAVELSEVLWRILILGWPSKVSLHNLRLTEPPSLSFSEYDLEQRERHQPGQSLGALAVE